MNFKYGNFRKFSVNARRPLFVGVSGSHAYGTVRPDSDLDVRVVRIPSIDWALALARPERGVERKLGNMDIVEHNLYHFISVLLHGNATFLENIFQEHLYEDTVFPEFEILVKKYGLTLRFAGHFYGFIRSAMRDYAKKKKIKLLLYGYRVGLSGIHFFTTARDMSIGRTSAPEVLYKMEHLLKTKAAEKYVGNISDLLKLYKTEADLIMPNAGPAKQALSDLKELQSWFGIYNRDKRKLLPSLRVQESGLPMSPRYDPFNKWIKKELIKELIC
jgi:hypothetical protein